MNTDERRQTQMFGAEREARHEMKRLRFGKGFTRRVDDMGNGIFGICFICICPRPLAVLLLEN
jgi:hypothetical protein